MCHDILVSNSKREKFKTAQTMSRQRIKVATPKEENSGRDEEWMAGPADKVYNQKN